MWKIWLMIGFESAKVGPPNHGVTSRMIYTSHRQFSSATHEVCASGAFQKKEKNSTKGKKRFRIPVRAMFFYYLAVFTKVWTPSMYLPKLIPITESLPT